MDRDPFLSDGDEGFESVPPDEADSIFSVSRAPGGDAAEAYHERPVTHSQDVPVEAPGTTPTEPVRQEPAPVRRIEDAVLNVLAQYGVLSDEQLAQLWSQLQASPSGTAWRVALTLPGVSRERILAVAAHVHKVPFIDLREIPHAAQFLAQQSLPAAFKQQCHELGLLPFAVAFGAESGQLEIKMAACDPLRPEVEAFVGGLMTKVHLHYAPQSMLEEPLRKLVAGV